MADKIRGITIELGGDASGLSKALKSVNSEIKDTQSQLRDVERLLKLDPSNITLLEQKQRLLNERTEEYKSKLKSLEEIRSKQAEQVNKLSKEIEHFSMKDYESNEEMQKAYEDLNNQLKNANVSLEAIDREIISTQLNLTKAGQEAEKFTEELAKPEQEVKKLDQALEKVANTAEKVGEKAEKVADATKGISTAAGAVLGAGVAGVGKIVSNYAEYEQLIGGTKLLFGEAFDYVVTQADTAYSRVQLSQSEYLNQVNGFATGLKTALGGNEQAAAELADRIVTAQADVVAATGNTQEAVQNAFNGIMRSNFTMLDNLQLGITPTKEGFQELIDKVNEWNTANGRATAYQMDNLADMESALVDYIDMQGLAGYAAAEGAETISGAFASAKAAVDNLITGLGVADADVDTLVGNVIASGHDVYDNIIPVLQAIWDNLPSSVKITAGILAVVAAISPLASAISKTAGAVEIVTTKVIPGVGKAFTWLMANPMALLVAAIVALVVLIGTKGDEIQALLQRFDDWLQGIFARDWTEVFGPILGNALNTFFANLKNVWDSVRKILNGIIDFIRGIFTGDWQRAWDGVKSIFSGVFSGLLAIAKAPINGIIGLINTALDSVNWLVEKINRIPGINIPTLGNLKFFANGGSLGPGGAAIVGEAGPELLTMQGSRAVVTPLGGSTTNNTTHMGGIAVNVYGAAGQNVDDLADAVVDKIQHMVDSKGAVFA